MKVAILILSAATVISVLHWFHWKVATAALFYYMEQKKYTFPDNEEMKTCMACVIRMMIKDLFHFESTPELK